MERTEKRTAVLILDFQNEIVSPDGKLYKEVEEVMKRTGVVQKLPKFVVAARESGALIIHSRVALPPNCNPSEEESYSGDIWPGTFVGGTPNVEIAKEMSVDTNVDVMLKDRQRYDAFIGTGLKEILIEKNVGRLFVGGFLTDLCVEETIHTAGDIEGLEIFALTDGTAARSVEGFTAALSGSISIMSTPVTCNRAISLLPEKKEERNNWNVLSNAVRKSNTRGTVVTGLFGKKPETIPNAVLVDGDGRAVSFEDKKPSRVLFRDSLIRRISVGNVPLSREPLPSTTQPKKTAMKSFNRDSLCVDHAKFESTSAVPDENSKVDFLMQYDLSEVMMETVSSEISQVSEMRVFLENSTSINVDDSKIVGGYRNNEDKYQLQLEKCPRHTSLQDVSYFLVHLAAMQALPTTFELLRCERSKGGIGKGRRRIGAHGESKSSPEDFIPLEEQVESAIELIEQLPLLVFLASRGCMEHIKSVKKDFDNNNGELLRKMKNTNKKMLVILMISNYPWGARGGERDLPDLRREFKKVLNGFTDVPVTFVFYVETRNEKVVEFYDRLLSPESGINANIRIAKGLGLQVDGISKHNPWINYCVQMHLCQAIGVCSNILSQASSRPLLASEVGELCSALIGNLPSPAFEMDNFLSEIEALMSTNDNFTKWSTITSKNAPYIDVKKLKRHLSKTWWFAGAVAICIVAIIAAHITFN
eukprot:CAMPEP_0183742522 /NCGR_PEP_ID=MMETSP0737-20130205/64743_1 /TAXON_ID=385413 /ORGANISM="Thalassiosira miniscula, Strain CCMP1093" /LENGTH=702 /DNA_ID=CAMNT_0025978109 /DNA_START=295 /DNA_END=2403 /DNA_ORIENTATION=+